MQVYRGMDIGTAKPSAAEQALVRHHMIDVVDPDIRFSVAEFQEAGRRVLAGLAERDVPALITGGSGLHFRALIDPLEFPPHDPQLRASIEERGAEANRRRLIEVDPAAGQVVDLANPRRVERALEVFELTGMIPSVRATHGSAEAVTRYKPLIPVVVAGIDPGAALADRVERRWNAMMAEGLLEEVAGLAESLGPTAAEAVGYKQLLPVVSGVTSVEQGSADARQATMSLAKRQRTYFRRDPRVEWVPWVSDPDERYELVKKCLVERESHS
jgi:tRNA dimethylallyltransferase